MVLFIIKWIIWTLFDGIVTEPVCMNLLPHIQEDFEDGDFYFQQDWASPEYHCDVRTYLDETLSNKRIERSDSVE